MTSSRVQGLEGHQLRRWGWAWVGLCVALAVHVADEALTGFLDFYNPLVQRMRAELGFFPMPTFTFWPWLIGLLLVTAIALTMSRFVFAGRRWMIPIAWSFSIIMLLNGLGHLLASLYFNQLVPGVYSSPILLVASIYLMVRTRWVKKGEWDE